MNTKGVEAIAEVAACGVKVTSENGTKVWQRITLGTSSILVPSLE